MKRFLMIFGFLFFAAPNLAAQTYESEFKKANALYNKGDYKNAIKGYGKAIQADPGMAPPYRNLARSYFWIESYAAASAYYDFYLRVAESGAKDLEQITQERKLASERAGSSVHVLPPNQKQALTALTQELSTGAAYTQGGGGAWALYKTLLRTGFAEPNLLDLRARLTRRLIDEFDATLIPSTGAFAPVVDLDGWRTQSQRLSAAREIAQDPAIKEIVNRRSKIVSAANALLSNDYASAASLSKTATAANPDVPFLPWFTVVALSRSNSQKAALEELKVLARNAKATPGLLSYATILRAFVLQQSGKSEDAADVLMSVLND